jgi:hypothetical protein
MRVQRGIGVVVAMFALSVAGGTRAAEPAASPVGNDAAAYEQLKSLAGLWAGKVADESSMDVQVRYGVMSSGKAVFEHLFPGTPHEMVTAYFLASGRLQATHYCAIGNQPAYRLSTDSTATDIRMEFAGGTGFDPLVDQHAHGVQIVTRDADHIEVEWRFQKGTEPTGGKRMLLTRVPAAS